MKKILTCFALLGASLFAPLPSAAQFNIGKGVNALKQGAQALTLTDAQMAAYVKEYIDWMDTHNKVCDENHEYTQRLRRLTKGLDSVEGIPLNFKVYWVVDVNAFACADGSVRVFAGLMDQMTDDELLGVIGHEIGHVAHKDSKKAFKTALLTSALKDAVGSTSGTASALTDSQLGSLSESLVNATYSQKQEKAADDYGYEFLKAHDKNPWAMALSFEKLQALSGSGSNSNSKINQLFSSHPDLPTRIKRMSERATKEGFTRPE
ncbi:MAG: M48 family metallopeptidase [Bacteroidales bacterium]|nr:M48 family metallopeptidase [Bacteroidales bacterium]